MTHIVLQIAYDGTSYLGWQKTKEGPSIEEALTTVLCQIFQEPLTLQAASRTDRGVHALGQVIDFVTSKQSLDLHRLTISLNQLLPSDIRCRKAIVAPTSTFHPTLDVIKKRYRYSISAGPVQLPHLRFSHWHVHLPLDSSLLHEAAAMIIGSHDFRGFCNRRADLKENNTVRNVYSIDITEDTEKGTLQISIEADHFLYKMARNIVGTLLWIACGKLPLSCIKTAISSRKRSFSGVTAPAHGLSLEEVFYPYPLFLNENVNIPTLENVSNLSYLSFT